MDADPGLKPGLPSRPAPDAADTPADRLADRPVLTSDVGADPELVLAGLDPEQREVALATRGPVCVLAGAGTGKTRAVAHRIAYAVRTGVVDPGHVLAVTFTTRAAGELRGRLRQFGGGDSGMERVQARTFHAAALRQLTHFWPRTVGGRAPAVLDSKITLLAETARRAGVTASLPELRDVASEIEWSKVSQVRPDDYPESAVKADRMPSFGLEKIARLYAGYEELRRDRHLVDFETVLELTAAILAEHRPAAAAVRDRYRYFVVDEYQDVNPLQKLLLDAWAGDRDDVCVVGDPRQTIYSFTGATPAYLTSFTAEFPDATVVRLVRNYRSTPQVVALANRLTGAAGARSLRAQLAPGRPGAASAAADALVAQQPAGPPPEFAEYGDEQEEATAVATRVGALIREGVGPRRIAVLVRINAQTLAFERAFGDAGVPCQVRGAERFFDRPEVRQAVGLLRAAVKSARPDLKPPTEDLSTGRLPNAASGGAAPGGAAPGGAGAGGAGAGGVQFPDAATAADSAEIRHILAGLGLTREAPAGRGSARDRWESLEALAQLGQDFFVTTPDASLTGFVAELAQRASIEHAPAMEGVTLASLHAAKGLEWDVVFLPGLTDGNLPIVHAQSEEAIEEERRLLYVGVTRARQRVFLSWPLARSPGGRRSRKPSRFLDGLWPERRLDGADGPDSADGTDRPARRTRRVRPAETGGPVTEADGPLMGRLRDWRGGVAREQGVPAYVVFSDATLRLIAARRPGREVELRGIPGVGQLRLARYGAAILALCADTDGDART